MTELASNRERDGSSLKLEDIEHLINLAMKTMGKFENLKKCHLLLARIDIQYVESSSSTYVVRVYLVLVRVRYLVLVYEYVVKVQDEAHNL